MATSSIPAAIDWLVGAVRALPQCAAPVVVEDGWPARQSEAGNVVIGITPEDDDTDNPVMHAQLGAQLEVEEPAVPCLVWAHRNGADAMKAARDAAFVIYDAVVTRVRQDRTLGGAVHSGVAILTNVRVAQTGTAVEAGEGRRCEIRFVVAWRNRF